MRVRLTILLAALLLACVVLAPPAHADFTGGTGGRGQCSAACGTTGGGTTGGGGGAPVNVWLPPAANYSHWGDLQWFSNQSAFGVAYAADHSPSNSVYTNLDQEMTKALLGYSNSLKTSTGGNGPDKSGGVRCDQASWTRNADCPLWYTQNTLQPFGSPLPGAADWSYNDHGGDPLHELIHPVSFVGPHALVVMWNVLVWRYDPETAATRSASDAPIFERTVVLDGATTAGYGTTSTTSGDYDTYWYYSGTAAAGGSGGRGGVYSNNYTSAGGLSTPEAGLSQDKAQCNSNVTNSYNGLRDKNGHVKGQAGFTPPVVKETSMLPGNNSNSAVRPTSPPYSSQGRYSGDASCYWEGTQLGGGAWGTKAGTGANHDTIAGRLAGVPNDEFGNIDSSDPKYQNDPMQRGGLKEAISLDWTTALNPNTAASIGYQILGVPNRWYAVQIVGMDNRQQLISQTPKITTTSPNADTWPTGSEPGAASNESTNYFRVFISDPTPCRVGEAACPTPGKNCTTSGTYCCPNEDTTGCGVGPTGGPSPTAIAGDPADPYVRLSADSPVAARTEAQQTLSIATDDPLLDTQAIFPVQVKLQHYTPQMAYDGGAGAGASVNAYQSAYVEYGNPAWVLPTLRPGPDLTHAFTDKSVQTQLAAVTQDQNGGNAGVLAQNTFDANWLQPTLSNPCSVQTDEMNSATGGWLPWPNTPAPTSAQCTPAGASDVFNAWDDYFSGLASWESRWVSDSSSTPTWGYIQGQQLRCNNNDSSALADNASNSGAKTSEGEDIFDVNVDCPPDGTNSGNDPQIPLSATTTGQGALFTTQQAQGYVVVAGDHTGNATPAADTQNGAGALRVRFDTNAASIGGGTGSIAAAAVWDRDTTDVQGLNPDSTPGAQQSNTQMGNTTGEGFTNTVARDDEMNFCRQGLPDATDHLALKNDAVVGANRADADPGCAGYDVNWDWAQPNTPQYTAACNAQPVYDGPAPSPSSNTFPAPSNPWWMTSAAYNAYPGLQAAAEADGTKYGYGADDSNPNMELAYGMSAVSSGGVSSPPYAGDRPGKNSGNSLYAPQPCAKTVTETGMYPSGHWVYTYSFWPKLGPAANCSFTSDPNTNTNSYGPDGLNTPIADGGYRPNDSVPYPYGTSTACGNNVTTTKKKVTTTRFKPDGTYRYGFWYRTGIQWQWDGSCTPVDQLQSGPKYTLDPSTGLSGAAKTAAPWVSSYVSWPNNAPPNSTNYGDEALPWNALPGWYFSNLVDDGATYRPLNHSYANPTYLTNAELAGRYCLTNQTRRGYLTYDGGNGGGWNLDHAAGPGWGINNTGARLNAGDYVVQYTFSNLNSANLSADASGNAATWWSMSADYDGHTDWTWSHENAANFNLASGYGVASEPTDLSHLSDSTQLVSVFSPRNQR